MRSRDGAEEIERRQRAAQHFDFVRTCALNGLNELTIHDRERVERVIAWLEEAIAGLLGSGAWRWSIDLATLSHAALTVFYGGDSVCMVWFAGTALGSGTHWTFKMRGREIEVEKLPVFSRALVDDLLEVDWRKVKEPMAYAARTAHNLAFKEAREDAPAGDAPLESIAGTPAESSDYGTVTEVAFAEGAREALEDDLKKIAEVDRDLATYGVLRLRGVKHKKIRAQFGWTRSHAYNVQVRYLRWQSTRGRKIAAAHAERVERGAISSASCTTSYEILEGGTLGRARPRAGRLRSGGGRGVWQHRKSGDDT
jgi:hypothetical protein